ncbi:MAG: hypothetical protein HQ526_05145 [Actinobacteria bacterium]|nr:hypothetical protein [Actinomycetota bacterium]
MSPGAASAVTLSRHLEVSSLNLACCALESATGVELWEALQSALGLAAESRLADSSPVHVLVVAGTVTNANAELVREAFDALAEPRAVVAFGACTISGGPYWDSYAVLSGISDLVPVDVFVSGCPPQAADLVAALTEIAAR